MTVLVVVLAGRVYRSLSHHETGWYLEAIPSALIVAAVCVLVSRLTHFQPGYLYGVLGGAVFIAALDRRGEGRAEVTASVVALGLALVAWVVFEPVAHAATKPSAGYPTLALDSLLACLFIGGLEGMLFGLVPLRFLPGARIKNWSWVAWAVLTAVVVYLFVHVLLMPESGYLGRSTAASVTTTIVLFVAFGVASALFWGYFRWRPTPEVAEEQVGADAVIEPRRQPSSNLRSGARRPPAGPGPRGQPGGRRQRHHSARAPAAGRRVEGPVVKRLAILLGASVLLLSGCGDRPGYDATAVEKYLASTQGQQFAGTGTVGKASCPRHRDLSEGMTVRCTLVVGGSKVPFLVTLTDVDASKVHVHAKPDGVVIPSSKLTAVVAQGLPAQSRGAKVDCGGDAFLVAKVGKTVTCSLVLGSQTRALKVTVKDASGRVSVSS